MLARPISTCMTLPRVSDSSRSSCSGVCTYSRCTEAAKPGRAHRGIAPPARVRRRPGRPRGRRGPAARRGRPGHRRRDGVRTTARDLGRGGGLPRAGHPRPGREHAPPALADAAPPLGNGFGLVVRALTDALPAYPGVPAEQSAQGLQLLCTDRADLAAAHGDWAAGRLPRCRRCRSRRATTRSRRRACASSRSRPSRTVRARRRRGLRHAGRLQGAAAYRGRRTACARASPTRYSGCTYRRRSSWSANCRLPVATSCTWRSAWPACSP